MFEAARRLLEPSRIHRSLTLLFALLVVTVFSAAGCAGGSGPDIALVYSFEAGDTWVHEVTTTARGTTEGLGDAAPASTDQTTKLRVTSTVESVDAAGTATISVTTETVETSEGGQTQDLTGALPQTVTVVIDKTGNVLSTQGGEDAAAGLIDSGSFLDPTDLSSELNNLLFPADGTAKVGEQWTTKSTIPLTGLDQELEVTTKAKLVGVATEDGLQVATIEYTTTMPMDLELDLGPLFSAMLGGSDDGSGLDLVFKMTTKGSVKLSGTTKVDTSTGQAVTTQATGTMDFAIEVTEAPEMLVPKDQRGPYDSAMTLEMQLVRVE